jgi:large subunit ribosomal protein L15
MMKLHELKGDAGRRQKRRRIGRGDGSGWGCTSGKGHKGQKARAGSSKGAAFEGGQMPLIRRIPKFGFSNVRFKIPRSEVTLRTLNRFEEGSTVDLAFLKEHDLIPAKTREIKVIATGVLEKKLTVRARRFSAGARAAIEAAGGVCETVES